MGERLFFSKLITKNLTAVDSQRRLFEGVLTVEMKDRQGEITIRDELMKVLPIWIARGGPITDTHSNRVVGKGINFASTTVEDMNGIKYPAITIQGEIFKDYELDNQIWEAIKTGKYKGLSFGGATKTGRTPILQKDGSVAYSLKDLEQYEVAVCEEPAVPLALITQHNEIAKAMAGKTVDRGNDQMCIICDKFKCYVDKSKDKFNEPDEDGYIEKPDCQESFTTKNGEPYTDVKGKNTPYKDQQAEALKKSELDMGRKVEMEHTDDPKEAEKIAMDHLKEDPHYYTKLGEAMPKEKKIMSDKTKEAGAMTTGDAGASEVNHGGANKKTMVRIKREFEGEGHGDPFDTIKSSPQDIQMPEKYGREAGVQQTKPAQSHIGNKKQQTERFNRQEGDFKRTNMARAGILNIDPKQAIKDEKAMDVDDKEMLEEAGLSEEKKQAIREEINKILPAIIAAGARGLFGAAGAAARGVGGAAARGIGGAAGRAAGSLRGAAGSLGSAARNPMVDAASMLSGEESDPEEDIVKYNFKPLTEESRREHIGETRPDGLAGDNNQDRLQSEVDYINTGKPINPKGSKMSKELKEKLRSLISYVEETSGEFINKEGVDIGPIAATNVNRFTGKRTKIRNRGRDTGLGSDTVTVDPKTGRAQGGRLSSRTNRGLGELNTEKVRRTNQSGQLQSADTALRNKIGKYIRNFGEFPSWESASKFKEEYMSKPEFQRYFKTKKSLALALQLANLAFKLKTNTCGSTYTEPGRGGFAGREPGVTRDEESESYHDKMNPKLLIAMVTDVADALKKAKKGPCWDGYEMVGFKIKNGKRVPNCVPKEKKKSDCGCSKQLPIEKAEDGKTLNKPFRTPGGPKKFAVYVKNPAGKTVIVRFGDPNMEIKRDDPDRRRSFRARHNCDEEKDVTTARYWSCKMWEKENSVSDYTNKAYLHDTENYITKPFAGYKDFADCVEKNKGVDDPEAYCGKIRHQIEKVDRAFAANNSEGGVNNKLRTNNDPEAEAFINTSISEMISNILDILKSPSTGGYGSDAKIEGTNIDSEIHPGKSKQTMGSDKEIKQSYDTSSNSYGNGSIRVGAAYDTAQQDTGNKDSPREVEDEECESCGKDDEPAADNGNNRH